MHVHAVPGAGVQSLPAPCRASSQDMFFDGASCSYSRIWNPAHCVGWQASECRSRPQQGQGSAAACRTGCWQQCVCGDDPASCKFADECVAFTTEDFGDTGDACSSREVLKVCSECVRIMSSLHSIVPCFLESEPPPALSCLNLCLPCRVPKAQGQRESLWAVSVFRAQRPAVTNRLQGFIPFMCYCCW